MSNSQSAVGVFYFAAATLLAGVGAGGLWFYQEQQTGSVLIEQELQRYKENRPVQYTLSPVVIPNESVSPEVNPFDNALRIKLEAGETTKTAKIQAALPKAAEENTEAEFTSPPPSMIIPSKGMKFQVEVSQTIKTAGGDLRSCLEPSQGDIKVTLLLHFGTSGFENVEIEFADEPLETVESCMNKALMAYAWPASSDDPVQIKMPMIFSFE